jgi:hypothetical protein
MQSYLRFLACLVLLASVSWQTGCSTLRKSFRPGQKEAKLMATPPPLQPQRVGTITLVNEDSRFVLIDIGSGFVPAEGTALKSFGDSVAPAVLAVGDVRRRGLIVADIVSGEPRKGDTVFR